MKRLLLMRHAKSDWSGGGTSDHERGLNARGERVAPQMGTLLDERFGAPDRIISSTAVRARRTAELVRQAAGWSSTVETTGEIYEAPVSAYLTLLRIMPEDFQNVLLVGHNPTLEVMISERSGQAVRMATATVAVFEFDGEDWPTIAAMPDWPLTDLLRPKEHDID